jgi:hypothetical protein
VLQRESETSFDVSGKMKQGQGSKRSRGRNGGRRGSNRQQLFDSNGPSVRIRGNAFQVHEKYLALARDAASAGDRIAAENYFQHAEHYFRIYSLDQEERAQRQPQNGQGPDGHRRHPQQNGSGHHHQPQHGQNFGNGDGRPERQERNAVNSSFGDEPVPAFLASESDIDVGDGDEGAVAETVTPVAMETGETGMGDTGQMEQPRRSPRRRKPASND